VENGSMDVSVADLLPLVEGTLLIGNPQSRIRGVSSLKEAVDGDLTFFYDARYLKHLLATGATAVLVPAGTGQLPERAVCIGVKDPSRAFEAVVEKYGLQPIQFTAGVHPSAVIGQGVSLDPSLVSVGPNAVIGDGAQLTEGVAIGAGAYVGPNVTIGKDSKLYANATVHQGCILGERVIIHSSAVIGADGFGYVFEEGRHRKIRQAGIVQIDNDVEVGAGTMVDRARFGRTRIGEGTKFDNLVQIGHNVVIGKHCIVIAHTGIAGSATIGDYVVIAAQSGVAGHVTVGSQVTLGSRVGVTKDLPGGKTYLGNPAVPIQEEQRARAGIKRIPQLLSRIAELESRLEALEKASDLSRI
jgi:UDP-3-O-[3-hydroxymyristoyl] glucosamine N-acyltransferase